MIIHSFAPIAEPGATYLILGSMPGQASLTAGQYYAHPRNSFWPIMGVLCAADPELPYQERIKRLTENGVAVWDVLKSCQRQGSLDANINQKSMVSNDFNQFFTNFPTIKQVFFNGVTAEKSFKHYVLANLQVDLSYQRLPSTSPAHAALHYQQKLFIWQQAFLGSVKKLKQQ